MLDAAKREQVARVRDIRSCDMHRRVKWSTSTHTPINIQPLKGMSRKQCADTCLDTPSCTAFELYVGNDPSVGSCDMYAMDTDNRDALIKPDNSRDRVIGFCEHDTDTKGSVLYETTRYEHSSNCTLMHSVKFSKQPTAARQVFDGKDSDSCTQACIDDPDCTAFDLYIGKDPAAGQCHLYAMEIPWEKMPSSGLVMTDPSRSHVVGLCTRSTTYDTVGYEMQQCPAHCKHAKASNATK